MKTLRFKENTIIRVGAIDSVNLNLSTYGVDTDKERESWHVSMAVGQMLFTESFDEEQKARAYFNSIIKKIEKA